MTKNEKPKPVIASMWVGPALTWIEQVCLKSFLDHGHEVILYAYEPIANVPNGVTIADAAQILPGDQIIRHARTGSPAYHADKFRLRLMEQTDYIWADTDAYCHRPIEVPAHGHLHGLIGPKGTMVNNGVLRLPKDSGTLAAMIEFTADDYPIPPWYMHKDRKELQARKDAGEPVHVSLLPWGVWGPNALTHFLKKTGELQYSLPQAALYPVPFEKKSLMFRPAKCAKIEAMCTDETLSVHLWGRRFRGVAKAQGGRPARGSFADKICEKHGIDPALTQHLLLDTTTQDGKSVDFTALTDDDLANLCLQRSEIMRDKSIVQAWVAGDDTPLRRHVQTAREAIAAQGFTEILDEFNKMKTFTDDLAPKRVVDIGCGYAFLDLILWRAYGCEIVLVDIENSKDRHFGFENAGAGYSSLATARRFLIANGVPETKITTINPTAQNIGEIGAFDLAISFLSCGFHYGLDTYDELFRSQVSTGGAIVVDVRKGSRGVKYLKQLGDLKILADERKHAKVAVVKAA